MNVAIIGNGIAGITAARHIRKLSDHQITVISYETEHHFSRTALMYVYMGHMTYGNIKPYEDWFWQKNRIDLVNGYVEAIDTERQQLAVSGGRTIGYDALIIATGSKSNKFGWPGQDLQGVQGLYSWQDLQTMERNTKGIAQGVIVGGGLIGIEVAEMLHSRHIYTSMLVREEHYWNNILPVEEADMIGRHIHQQGIDLRLGSELKKILSDGEGRVMSVLTTDDEEIPCEFVALTAGVSPNIEVVKRSAVETGRGVLVNQYFETNIPNIYAIGDCAEFHEPQPLAPKVEQLWYTGKMHGEVVAQTICGNRTRYNRGVWFNSAKFFDIEYQTYGYVGNKLREGEATLYWEHPDGLHSIRINYDAASHHVNGFNLFGIRYRQEVCSRWIREGRTLEYVVQHLGEANFDPEFFRHYEPEVLKLYNQQNPNHPLPQQRKPGRAMAESR
ncbi:MAG: NAD(P)/FAD-dependent oxidoreductase [Chlorobi bacterium CHB2]|nr:NAD(P)/FAD-dependent oxidoreductase [Chlorobi bacterium CHB2]